MKEILKICRLTEEEMEKYLKLTKYIDHKVDHGRAYRTMMNPTRRDLLKFISTNVKTFDQILNEFDLGQYASRGWKDLNSPERIEVLNLDNQKDGSIEVLMAIDSQREPIIARKIDKGEPLGVSMGTNIDYSDCTVCGKRAYFEFEYCNHIKFGKNATVAVQANQIRDNLAKGKMREEWLPFVLIRSADRHEVINGSQNRIVLAKTFEINYGCSFFELSAVANPAYDKGYMLEKVASKQSYSNIDWSKYSNEQLIEIYNFVTGVING